MGESEKRCTEFFCIETQQKPTKSSMIKTVARINKAIDALKNNMFPLE